MWPPLCVEPLGLLLCVPAVDYFPAHVLARLLSDPFPSQDSEVEERGRGGGAGGERSLIPELDAIRAFRTASILLPASGNFRSRIFSLSSSNCSLRAVGHTTHNLPNPWLLGRMPFKVQMPRAGPMPAECGSISTDSTLPSIIRNNCILGSSCRTTVAG